MTHNPSSQSPREVELKLSVPEGSVGALLQHPVFQASAARQTHRRHEVTTYFDTADQALARCGMSLRVRRTEGKRVQTLKADGKDGIAADRAEWEWPVEQEEPDLGLVTQLPISGELPRPLDVEPVLVTAIDRTIYVLELDGGAVVEAALDAGSIAAGPAGMAVHELELELKRGGPATLYRLALDLHAIVPLMVESESKAARGYRLKTGAVPAARKAEDVVVEPKASAAEALRRIVVAALGHLLVNQPAARSGDAEGVHQMRVAIRRLRAALTLFEPHLEPHAASLFQAELRRVGRVFGEARDWDVFCLQILPKELGTATEAGWRDLLMRPARQALEAAHRRFEQALQAPSFTALVLGLAAWVEQAGLPGDATLERPIEDLCPRLLDRLARKVERRGRHIGRRSDTERHALRKSLKKLRYAIDYVLAMYSHKSAKAYLHHCKKLQETLGDINDVATATALAEGLGKAARPGLAPAIGALAEHLDRTRDEALQDLSKHWRAFRAEPRFWA